MLRLQNLFALSLLVSYFLPWAGKIQRFSETPVNGFEYLLFTIVAAPPVAYMLTVIFACAAAILIYNLRKKPVNFLRTLLLLLVAGAFLFGVSYHVAAGMMHGQTFLQSLHYQLSEISYGVCVALVSAIGVHLTGGRAGRDRT